MSEMIEPAVTFVLTIGFTAAIAWALVASNRRNVRMNPPSRGNGWSLVPHDDEPESSPLHSKEEVSELHAAIRRLQAARETRA